MLRTVAPQASLPERAAQDIREAIRAGAYPEGRLPAEPVLAQQLGISKATVRHAVSILEQEGLLSRRHGAGTFVVGQALELRNNLSVNFGVTDLIRAAGFAPGAQAISVSVEPADEQSQRALGLEIADEVIVLRRTRTADGKAVASTTDVVALRLLLDRGLSKADAVKFVREHQSIYDALAELGILVRDGVAEIIPWKADSDLATALSTTRGTLLLRLDQTDYDINGSPIVSSIEFFLADTFKFQVYRKGTPSRATRGPRGRSGSPAS